MIKEGIPQLSRHGRHCADSPTRGWPRIAITTLLLLGLLEAQAEALDDMDLMGLDIETLMNIEVISTARQAQPLADAASAVFVITQEDLRRSGVTSVPEALRMVPGMQVARIDANKWAITARGFNGRFANKLLVLIDGRTVYTPSFSGVYWEVQDLLLEDIERIEVIRGPGASLWGANAVNGVINILTKHAADTQGGLVSLTVGDEERAILGLRYGGQLGENAYYRVFGKYLERDDLVDERGDDSGDNWDLQRGGFRLDWDPTSRHVFSVQGDLYEGSLDQTLTVPTLTPPFNPAISDNVQVSGGFLQGRWEFTQSPTSQYTVQSYYQQEERNEIFLREQRDTFDIDFQHNISWGDRQEIVWGLGYRYASDDFTDTQLSVVSPSERDTNLFSAFVQDTIQLLDDKLAVTLGTKLEHNDYTNWELQPSVRALWTPHPKHRVWAAVSRAVRTPSRGENDARVNIAALPPAPPLGLPVVLAITGDASFNSEKLIAYEVGYRTWPLDNLSLDAAAFYFDYDSLRQGTDVDPNLLFIDNTLGGPHLTAPLVINNGATADLYGFELAADWRPLDPWRLQLAYSFLRPEINTIVGGVDEQGENEVDPRHQVSLRSAFDIRDNLELDVWLRYVDELKGITTVSPSGVVRVDDYFTLDIRLGWQPRQDLEFSLVGTNLIDDKHLEFASEANTFPTQVERGIYGQVKWLF
jgi:iron complex outermembrane receptor protein